MRRTPLKDETGRASEGRRLLREHIARDGCTHEELALEIRKWTPCCRSYVSRLVAGDRWPPTLEVAVALEHVAGIRHTEWLEPEKATAVTPVTEDCPDSGATEDNAAEPAA